MHCDLISFEDCITFQLIFIDISNYRASVQEEIDVNELKNFGDDELDNAVKFLHDCGMPVMRIPFIYRRSLSFINQRHFIYDRQKQRIMTISHPLRSKTN